MNVINVASILTDAPSSDLAKPRDPAKIREAAQQFEALLLGQILRSARGSGGWLGSGGDAAGDCSASLAEQHFAAMLAQQGGLGLAALIEQGLGRER